MNNKLVRRYPEGLSEEVVAALDEFSPEEQRELEAAFSLDGRFLGIGFNGPDGEFTKHADQRKAAATIVLERAYLEEFGHR